MSEVILKALRPSATQAKFMANNTILPFLVWIMILKKKTELENEALDDNNFDKKNNIKTLRSGVKYIIPKGIEMNLKEKMLNESLILFNSFIFQQKISRKHANKKAITYDCALKLINYLINWSHIIILNSNVYHNKNFHNLYRVLRMTSLRLSSEINQVALYPDKTEKQRQYSKWLKEIANDIIIFQGYITCICNWHLYHNKERHGCEKCDVCLETEQYFYNHDNYLNSFTVLRNGRQFRQHNTFIKPIIVQNVYQIVGT